jgi:hypothetical protein
MHCVIPRRLSSTASLLLYLWGRAHIFSIMGPFFSLAVQQGRQAGPISRAWLWPGLATLMLP